MAESDALYLVDGSGFIFRAYHALPPLTTREGIPTGAVYGFAQMLIKLEQDFRPSHLAVVFDAGGVSFRDRSLLTIRRTGPRRRPAWPAVRVIATPVVPSACGDRARGLEADDIIAT